MTGKFDATCLNLSSHCAFIAIFLMHSVYNILQMNGIFFLPENCYGFCFVH